MVHPYLRRREGKEKAEYPKPELRAVLEKTLGVPLFQEQAMKVAIVGAGFTLPRPIAAPRHGDLQDDRRGQPFLRQAGGRHGGARLQSGFAERTFKQIEGSAAMAFPRAMPPASPKSPMPLLDEAPSSRCLLRFTAQRPADGLLCPGADCCGRKEAWGRGAACSINHSHWDCTLEHTNRRNLAVRLGFRQVRGLANVHGARIVAARGVQPYGSVEEVWRRAGVPRAAIERLAEADAFAAIAQDRRQGLWKVKGWAMPPASSRRPMRRRISFHLR
jgi:error-prone DNA polymerase